jgi:hypothetical protein
MCEFKTLHLDDKLGYVLQCIHCKHITIGFGIVVFSRNLTDFYKLVQDTHSCYAHHIALGIDPKARTIPFLQLSEQSCLTVSLNDLYYLGELLDFACAKLQLERMISILPNN